MEYLNSSDIEREGWILEAIYRDGGTKVFRFNKNKDTRYELTFTGENEMKDFDRHIRIVKINGEGAYKVQKTLYRGLCETREDLRTLTKLIEIYGK